MEIVFEEDKKRSIALDSGNKVGECDFKIKDGYWTIVHTEVDKDYSGQGIARKLVDKIVDEARDRDIKLKATCPYALKLFESHDEYSDVFVK